jgi:hypothetical protein
MKQMGLQVVISSSLAALVTLAVFLLVPVTGAQSPGLAVPMISDWSHRHVVFSQPVTFEEAWRLQVEPRYWMQVLGRKARRNGQVDSDIDAHPESVEGSIPDFELRREEEPRRFDKDWGQSLGAGGSTGIPLVGGSWWPVFPAKFSFNIHANPNCTKDYVVFPTNVAGVTGGQASVIAYNKLYAGAGSPFCGVANPSVYWSYNTNFNKTGVATTGTVQTSPVLSLDGSKVAFVETRTAANGGAILHLLKWHAGDGGAINAAVAPAIATVWTADGLAGHCPVSGACMISVVLNGIAADTASSPFYDYQRDSMYVGDDKSKLHKIVNAFGISGATPSEVVTGWPIVVDSTGTVIVTSPTLDSVSGNIFVEDSSGILSYVRETFSTAGTCAAGVPPCLGSTNINPPNVHVVTDAPIVDSTTGKVFAFYGNNGLGSSTAVVQSDVTLSTSVAAALGTGTGHHLHAGAFDNSYLTGNGSVGRLYMCGSSGNSTPTIQRIGFTNSGRVPASPFANPVGTMNTAVDTAKLAVATNSAECAPVTELFNANAAAATQDQIFFGVQTLGNGTNCGGGGCVMSINVTNIPATLAIAHSIAEINGPSGIIVDNVANTTTFPQASSLYFSSQGNSTAGLPCGATTGVGCAVKVTQAGLQ